MSCLRLATEWIEIIFRLLPLFSLVRLGLATEWIEIFVPNTCTSSNGVSVLRPSGLKCFVNYDFLAEYVSVLRPSGLKFEGATREAVAERLGLATEWIEIGRLTGITA